MTSYVQPIESTARNVGGAVTKPEIARDLAAGALTGQIAGLMMATAMMTIFTVFLGKSPFYPVQVIGSLLLGEGALNGFHVPALFVGLLLHQFGPSLFWGVGFGLVTHFLDIRRGARLMGLALGTGILSQIIDVNMILPAAFEALQGHDIWAEQVPAFWSWAAHAVFGFGLASFSIVYDCLGTAPSRGSPITPSVGQI